MSGGKTYAPTLCVPDEDLRAISATHTTRTKHRGQKTDHTTRHTRGTPKGNLGMHSIAVTGQLDAHDAKKNAQRARRGVETLARLVRARKKGHHEA